MMKWLKGVAVSIVLVLLLGSFGYAETVTIIAEDDWYPYAAKFDDGPKGIAVDIARAAFEAEGLEVKFDVMNYDRGMGLVEDGQAIGCFDAPRSDEIESVYLWHDEAMFSADCFYYGTVDYKGSINSPKDLAGRKVGFTQGYGYGTVIDLDTEMVKEYSKNDTILIKKLIAGRLKVVVLFDKVADYLIPKLNVEGKIKQIGKTSSTDIYIAFSKRHPDGKKYRDIFSRGFRKIKKNGTYQKIFDAWDERFKGMSQ